VLRVVMGLIVVAHGVQKLADSAAWQGQLAHLGLPEPEIAAPLLIAAELLGGLGLLFGLLTRTAAFVNLCVVLVAIVAIYLTHGLTMNAGFDLPLLLLATTVFFLATGGGPLSADTTLRNRARRKAIEQDETWHGPPYVPASE
jgi:putative oxidoreductase